MATYVYKDDQQLGPFEDEQVLGSLADGIFSYDDLAWREGWQDWKPLGSIYPPGSPKYSSQAPLAPAQKQSPPPNATTARRRRKSEFLGKGALVQLLAVVLFFVVVPFAGGLVAFISALILFVIGSSMSRSWICGACGNKLSDKNVKMCPTCRSAFTK